jgi:hypothetical protein
MIIDVNEYEKLQYIPWYLHEFLKVSDCAIAGGYLRDLVMGKEPNDIDIFHTTYLDKVELSKEFGEIEDTTIDQLYEGDVIDVTNIQGQGQFLGKKFQFIEVSNVYDAINKFPCNLSKIMLTRYGLTITEEFMFGMNFKMLKFYKGCPDKYKNKICAKFPEFSVLWDCNQPKWT